LVNAPAMPRVKASIVPMELAVTVTSVVSGTSGRLSPVALTFWRMAVVVLVMWFSAAAAPAAIAPNLS